MSGTIQNKARYNIHQIQTQSLAVWDSEKQDIFWQAYKKNCIEKLSFLKINKKSNCPKQHQNIL